MIQIWNDQRKEWTKKSMNRWLSSVWFEEPPIVRQKRMAIPLTFQRLRIHFWRTPSKWRMQTAHVLISTFENLYFFCLKVQTFYKTSSIFIFIKSNLWYIVLLATMFVSFASPKFSWLWHVLCFDILVLEVLLFLLHWSYLAANSNNTYCIIYPFLYLNKLSF